MAEAELCRWLLHQQKSSLCYLVGQEGGKYKGPCMQCLSQGPGEEA